MRRNISETPVYNERIINKGNLNPILSSWKHQWRDYLLALSITLLPATAFYFVFVFLPNYLSHLFNIKAEKILMDNSIILFLRLLMIPILGFTADKVGGIKIAQLASILFIVLSVPVLYGMVNFYHNFYYSIYIFSLFTTLNAATTPGLLIELLRPETRCTTLSFTLNISFGVLGGMVPFIGFLLSDMLNNASAPAYYLMFTGIITLIGLLLLKNRQGAYDKHQKLLTNID
jgi:MHS family proline/betaine transporter-like MFS transporter